MPNIPHGPGHHVHPWIRGTDDPNDVWGEGGLPLMFCQDDQDGQWWVALDSPAVVGEWTTLPGLAAPSRGVTATRYHSLGDLLIALLPHISERTGLSLRELRSRFTPTA
jgi:hypothetical protein